ncbi:hypothetical protein VTN77DRAFT_3425 [Rasamsonia byssochlamydoides]|uniref:uncharacterized protein n=1 Tax=Rasamsonia byssochlamydoides TaxID=89139 RepID=UPI00374260F2
MEDGKTTTVKSLEQRYIQLLEEKIAHLEVEAKQRNENDTSGSKDDDAKKDVADKSADGDGKEQADGKKEDNTDSSDVTRKKPRVRYLQRTRDEFGDYVDKEVEGFSPEDESKEDKEASEGNKNDLAISWRRSALDGEVERQVLIESTALRKALKEVMTDYPEISFDTEEVAFDSPYAPLYHSTKQLKEYAEKADTDEATKMDILTLLEELDTMQSKERRDAERLAGNGQIQYDLLWTLFYPRCLVCQMCMDHLQISMVAPSALQRDREDKYFLNLWSIDFDGTNYKYVGNRVSFETFKGSKSITDLEVYPLSYWKSLDGSESVTGLKEKLIRRGEAFEKLCNTKPEQRLRSYGGPILDEGTLEMLTDFSRETDTISDRDSSFGPVFGPRTRAETERLERKTSVIVDHYAYTTYGMRPLKLGDKEQGKPVCNCTTCSRMRREYAGDLPSKQGKKLAKLSPEQLLLCPPRVCGFVVQSKRWVQMLVDNIEEIPQRDKDEAFDKLELPAKTKKLLKSLVMEHAKGSGSIDDLIPGKGAGLIVLLHGPPGVGKTLTAESLAMLTGKPLYNVNISDIGSTPDVVEQNFKLIFELATHWSALLLFDEADVFLERRSLQDMRRNSLVSVLLRILEYFQGILFLTSNRVKTFDEAFQSRIHLAVQYKKLEGAQRARIWRTWLAKGRNSIEDYDDIQAETEDGGELYNAELNGRQIRNVFRSAMALARADGDKDPEKKMNWGHLKQVLDTSIAFQAYMHQTEEVAQRDGLR